VFRRQLIWIILIKWKEELFLYNKHQPASNLMIFLLPHRLQMDNLTFNDDKKEKYYEVSHHF